MPQHRFTREVYQDLRTGFEREILAQLPADRDWASPFWQRRLALRRNYPSYSGVLQYRRKAHDLGAGEGYTKRRDAHRYFRQSLDRFLALAPREFLERNPEGLLGNPRMFKAHGVRSAGIMLHNAAIAYRVLQVVEQHQGQRHRLSVLEIGAGYGGVAKHLMANLPVDSYVICDLPENLFLSACYLASHFWGDYQFQFVHGTPPEPVHRTSILFATPAGLNLLESTYDLAINTWSMQEIMAAACAEYFRYIRQHLKPGGLFYFLNYHGFTNDVLRPSMYHFEWFDLVSFGSGPAQQRRPLTDRALYEFIGSAPGNGAGGDHQWLQWIDGYWGPLSAGVVPGLPEITPHSVPRLREDGTGSYLVALAACFREHGRPVDLDRLEGLSPPPQYRAIHDYLLGGAYLVKDRDRARCGTFWNRSLDAGLSGLAGFRAALGMWSLEGAETARGWRGQLPCAPSLPTG